MNVAIEAYRSGAITPAQVQESSETESFLRRAEAFHDYTMDDLERDITAIRAASRNDRVRPGCSVCASR